MADDLPSPAAARRLAADAERDGAGDAAVGGAEMVLGAALFEAGQVALALEAFERATTAYDAAGEADGSTYAALNRARTLSALGRAEEAESVWTDLAASPAHATHAAHALHALSEHHEHRGETDAADAALARLRSLYEREHRDLLPGLDQTVAMRLLDRGEHATAAAAFARVAALHDRAGDHRLAGECELYRGIAHHRAGETHHAEDAYVRAMSAYAVAGDAAGTAAARQNLDTLHGR